MNNTDQNVFVIRGGQGASKTISILELIIQSVMASEKEATILSAELSKMKRTVIRDYKKICKDWGIITGDEFNKSESKHDYPNDSYVDFLGADVNDIGKGFRRDILYINEADRMDIETAIQFISRAKLTIIDYNPDQLFWGDELITANNFLTLTFEDNEFLPEEEVKAILDYKQKGFHDPELPYDLLFKEENIKSKYWANKWRVYGLGLTGNLEGVVFDNWSEVEVVPIGAELIAYGQDFGFTNDPSALVAVYRYDKGLVIDELLYRTGLTNSDLIEQYNSLGLYSNIVADSAEPKSIEEIRRAGYSVSPARKGPDSIRASIQILQTMPWLVTKRSVNVKSELKTYLWKKDKMGKSLNEPEDRNNHAMDAIRYVALNYLTRDSETRIY